MNRYHQTKNFSLSELVCEETLTDKGTLAWRFFNPLTLITADLLRDTYGPAFVNTWDLSEAVRKAYGLRVVSGLRIPGSPNYSIYSDHTRGNALDMIFRDTPAQQIRQDIITGKLELPAPVILECTIGGAEITWLHAAFGNTTQRVTELHL